MTIASGIQFGLYFFLVSNKLFFFLIYSLIIFQYSIVITFLGPWLHIISFTLYIFKISFNCCRMQYSYNVFRKTGRNLRIFCYQHIFIGTQLTFTACLRWQQRSREKTRTHVSTRWMCPRCQTIRSVREKCLLVAGGHRVNQILRRSYYSSVINNNNSWNTSRNE